MTANALPGRARYERVRGIREPERGLYRYWIAEMIFDGVIWISCLFYACWKNPSSRHHFHHVGRVGRDGAFFLSRGREGAGPHRPRRGDGAPARAAVLGAARRATRETGASDAAAPGRADAAPPAVARGAPDGRDAAVPHAAPLRAHGGRRGPRARRGPALDRKLGPRGQGLRPRDARPGPQRQRLRRPHLRRARRGARAAQDRVRRRGFNTAARARERRHAGRRQVRVDAAPDVIRPTRRRGRRQKAPALFRKFVDGGVGLSPVGPLPQRRERHPDGRRRPGSSKLRAGRLRAAGRSGPSAGGLTVRLPRGGGRSVPDAVHRDLFQGPRRPRRDALLMWNNKNMC